MLGFFVAFRAVVVSKAINYSILCFSTPLDISAGDETAISQPLKSALSLVLVRPEVGQIRMVVVVVPAG